ncbi:hypothetical protein [Opitutus sp. ER46]|uniref:hypothetical protein n=1 Tax=Opitutus sp. ER46 TaxID=2161864 RepID=UPI001304C817|nr:hypothetical protein [Opitutus sp. ER46]
MRPLARNRLTHEKLARDLGDHPESQMVWLNDVFGGTFPVTWSLGIIAAILAGSVAISLRFVRPKAPAMPGASC